MQAKRVILACRLMENNPNKNPRYPASIVDLLNSEVYKIRDSKLFNRKDLNYEKNRFFSTLHRCQFLRIRSI